MTRGTKAAALVLSPLLLGAGCAQVFGLGDYVEAPVDGGEDGTMGAGDSGHESGSPADGPHGDSASDAGKPDSGATDASDAHVDAPVFAADACTGATTCAAAPPSGWQGPLAFWAGTGTAPACSGYYIPAFAGGLTPSAPSATCNCTCDPPSGSTCGSVTVQFGTGGCSPSCGSASIAPTGCANVQTIASGCGTGAQYTVSGSTASGGTCQPDASVTLPPATWATQAIACAPSGESPTGCASGEQCVPTPPTAFGSSFCVLKAGMNPCPSGSPYSTQHLYYGSVNDTRGCTACTCGSPTGVDCNSNGHITAFGNTTCTANQSGNFTSLPVTCQTASPHSIAFTTTAIGGACSPSGGQANGGVSAQDVTTICCTP